MSREMKDSGVEWIGKIPKEWKSIRFKFLHHGTNVGESIDKEYWTSSEEDTVFYTAGSVPIHTNYPNFPSEKYTTIDDLLLSRNGTPYVYLPESDSTYTDHIIRTTIKEMANREYVRYSLQQSISFEVVDTVSITTWSASIWNDQYLPFPELSYQNKIVDCLNDKCIKIDQVIEKTKQTIEEYKKLKQSIITEAVTKGIRKDRPMKDSGIEWIGEIPEDWKITALKRLSEKITDGSHFSPEVTDDGYPYVTAADVYGIGLRYDQCKKISKEDYFALVKNGCRPSCGDVLIVKDGATTGRVGLMIDSEPCVLLSSVAMVTPKNRISSKYLMRVIESELIQYQIKKNYDWISNAENNFVKIN